MTDKEKHMEICDMDFFALTQFSKQCGRCRQFFRKNNIQQHLKTCVGLKDHLCAMCGNTFGTKACLDSHTCRNYFILACSLCSLAFNCRNRRQFSDDVRMQCFKCCETKTFLLYTVLCYMSARIIWFRRWEVGWGLNGCAKQACHASHFSFAASSLPVSKHH